MHVLSAAACGRPKQAREQTQTVAVVSYARMKHDVQRCVGVVHRRVWSVQHAERIGHRRVEDRILIDRHVHRTVTRVQRAGMAVHGGVTTVNSTFTIEHSMLDVCNSRVADVGSMFAFERSMRALAHPIKAAASAAG